MTKNNKKANSYIEKSHKILKSKEECIELLLSTLNVVGEITRFKIIFLLRDQKKLYINEISEILGISQSAVSHQVNVLQRAGLIKKKREGQRKSCSLVPSKLISDLLKNLQAIEKFANN